VTQAKTNFVPKTLPYFVGESKIKAQLLVCQEKNIILEIIFHKTATTYVAQIMRASDVTTTNWQ
jgi:hypothetical protein